MTEVYLQPELEELITEPDKKQLWEEKITELGLEGQQSLTKNSEKSSASPYTFMNTQMKLVFNTLCPGKSTVEKYAKSTIPLDILSHIALCKQEGYFKKLEIWYDDKTPDPILVGYLSDSYSSDIHIIARWGDEICPYETLLEKAIKRFTEGQKLGLESALVDCEAKLKSVVTDIKQLFSGAKSEWNINPQFARVTPF